MDIFFQNKVALRLYNTKAELPNFSSLHWNYSSEQDTRDIAWTQERDPDESILQVILLPKHTY